MSSTHHGLFFPNNCSVSFWYCIVQCTHWSRTYSPTPAPYLQPWPACSCSLPVIVPSVFPGISGNRKVLSCICVKFLCIFGVPRSTLTSQWLHSVPLSFWCHSVNYTHTVIKGGFEPSVTLSSDGMESHPIHTWLLGQGVGKVSGKMDPCCASFLIAAVGTDCF